MGNAAGGGRAASSGRSQAGLASLAFHQCVREALPHDDVAALEARVPQQVSALHAEPSLFGRCLLHQAALLNATKCCRYLVQRCAADVVQLDQANRTPLHLAARDGSADASKYLCTLSNAQSDLRDTSGYSAFLYAVRGGHFPICELLLDCLFSDASVSPEDSPAAAASLFRSHCLPDGRGAVHLAAQEGHLVVLQMLWRRIDIDVNRPDQGEGRTPLLEAAFNGKATVCDFLLQQCSADPHAVDKKGRTALHLAAANDHVDTCRYLVQQAGLDPNQHDNHTRTAVDYANEHRSKRTAEFFLANDSASLLL